MAWIRATPFGHHDGDDEEMEKNGNLFYSRAGGVNLSHGSFASSHDDVASIGGQVELQAL
jgi:hypothetical protein